MHTNDFVLSLPALKASSIGNPLASNQILVMKEPLALFQKKMITPLFRFCRNTGIRIQNTLNAVHFVTILSFDNLGLIKNYHVQIVTVKVELGYNLYTGEQNLRKQPFSGCQLKTP